MVDDNNDRKDAKRQKLLSDQRSAYEEDMARINAALNEQPGQPPAATDREEEKNENSGVTEQPQQPQQQQQQGGHESDEEEDGNWLRNFTPHHTRVGENFQVADLPTPSATSHSTSAAAIIPKQ